MVLHDGTVLDTHDPASWASFQVCTSPECDIKYLHHVHFCARRSIPLFVMSSCQKYVKMLQHVLVSHVC
jgi:hypothetical protein